MKFVTQSNIVNLHLKITSFENLAILNIHLQCVQVENYIQSIRVTVERLFSLLTEKCKELIIKSLFSNIRDVRVLLHCTKHTAVWQSQQTFVSETEFSTAFDLVYVNKLNQ